MNVAETLFSRRPWLIAPDAHAAMCDAVRAFFGAPEKLPEPAASDLLKIVAGIGIVSVDGPLIRKPDIFSRNLFGAADTEEVIAAVKMFRICNATRSLARRGTWDKVDHRARVRAVCAREVDLAARPRRVQTPVWCKR